MNDDDVGRTDYYFPSRPELAPHRFVIIALCTMQHGVLVRSRSSALLGASWDFAWGDNVKRSTKPLRREAERAGRSPFSCMQLLRDRTNSKQLLGSGYGIIF